MTFHQLPQSAAYVVVGAGMHGMSTAWHLAMTLEKSGRGRGSDVVLIDKSGPGAGATGIACGCVRNLYMTGPLHTILKHSVDVWQSDPVNFGFQQVGYVSVGESNQQTDYEHMHQSQNASGYPSDLYVGQDARRFLKSVWPDFNVEKADVVLHDTDRPEWRPLLNVMNQLVSAFLPPRVLPKLELREGKDRIQLMQSMGDVAGSGGINDSACGRRPMISPGSHGISTPSGRRSNAAIMLSRSSGVTLMMLTTSPGATSSASALAASSLGSATAMNGATSAG